MFLTPGLSKLQADCILPGVLESLPSRKRRELARLWQLDKGKTRQPKLLRTRASASSAKVEEECSRITLGTVHIGVTSGAATTTTTEEAAIVAAARDTRNDHGFSQPDLSHKEELQQRRQKRVSATAIRSDRQGTKHQVRRLSSVPSCALYDLRHRTETKMQSV